jgi:hypothetical protein
MIPWGCPSCRSTESRVRDTGHDDEGFIVRLRRCLNCNEYWATEERPMSVHAFWARNASKRKAIRNRSHKQVKTCLRCGQLYKTGWYTLHVRFSDKHESMLTPTARNRIQARRISRAWARKHRNTAKMAENGPKRLQTGPNRV